MERIAIISDIHGNLEALKSVIKDIESRGIKRIFCLGDIIAKGVNSSECLEIIRDKCEVILQGNCDLTYSKDLNIEDYDGIYKKRIIWNKEKLTKEQCDFLYNLPFCYEFYMGGSLIRLFHASPINNETSIADLDTLDRKKSLFLPSDNTISRNIADVIIYGHIHTQILEHLYNRTIVNVGSVGNPIDIIRNNDFDGKCIETTRAQYLIIEGEYNSKTYDSNLSYQFIKVPYDIGKELNTEKDNIEKEDYILELKEGKYRDMHILKGVLKKRHIDVDEF